MTYNKEEYILHNGKKISVIYDDHNICQVSKECIESLLDLYQQGRTDAIDECIEVFRNIPRHYYLDEFLNELEQLKEQEK